MAQNSKRGRSGRRRQGGGGNNPNRSMDSQGPEVKIRGTAQQIYDKYTALARDAFSSGDRVRGESLQQHAEHYYRMLRVMQPEKFAAEEAKSQDSGEDQSQDSQDEGKKDQPEVKEEPVKAAQADAPSNRDAVEKDTEEAAARAESDGDEDGSSRPRRRRRSRRSEKGEASSEDAPKEAQKSPEPEEAPAA